MVSLSAPSGPFGITIPIVVTGGTASADEYSAPGPVVFSSGSDRQTVSIPLGDDALIEGDETISRSPSATCPRVSRREPTPRRR